MKRFIFTERGGIYIIDLTADLRAARGGLRLRPQHRAARRHDPLRRHEEAGPGRGRPGGAARRHAVRHQPLARRPADELAHDHRPDRAPARAAPAEDRGPARAAAREGADRACWPSSRSSRRTSAASPTCAASRTPSSSSTCGRSSSPCARRAGSAADHRARRHELRPGRGRLHHPGQRRRDPLVRPDRARDRRRRSRPARPRSPRRSSERANGNGARRRRRAGAASAAERRRRDEPPPEPPRGRGRRPAHGEPAAERGGAGPEPSRAGRGGRVAEPSRAVDEPAEPRAARPSDRAADERAGRGGDAREPRSRAALVKELRDATGARDDGLQARAPGDGRRPRGGADAPARARHGPGGQARRPRDDRGHRRLPARERRPGTMVAVGCETEPVSKNDEFQAFAKKVLEAVDARRPGGGRRSSRRSASSSSASSARTSSSSAPSASRPATARSLGAYAHPPANKIGVLVKLAAARRSSRASSRCTSRSRRPSGRRRRTCRPRWSRPRSRSTSTRTSSRASRSRRRRRSSRACSRSASSPPSRRVLTEQPWIHDSAKTVGQALADAGAQCRRVQALLCRRIGP